MIETCPKTSEQQMANLMALHRQLQEITAKRKSSSRDSKQQPDHIHGPMLVIRGK